MADKQYKKLEKKYDYDKEKAEELADAANEMVKLRQRLNYLEKLVENNKELKPFLWQTKEGKVYALHQIEDDHLRNIINYLQDDPARMGPSDELLAEASRRGIAVNATPLMLR